MRRLSQCCSSHQTISASCTLRASSLSRCRNTFFTSCMVMVLAPNAKRLGLQVARERDADLGLGEATVAKEATILVRDHSLHEERTHILDGRSSSACRPRLHLEQRAVRLQHLVSKGPLEAPRSSNGGSIPNLHASCDVEVDLGGIEIGRIHVDRELAAQRACELHGRELVEQARAARPQHILQRLLGKLRHEVHAVGIIRPGEHARE